VSVDAPRGWQAVFEGECLRAEVLQAVLEANGLEPQMLQLEAADLIPTVAFDRCRLFVAEAEASRARELLEEADRA
jgi:hypothetical protein